MIDTTKLRELAMNATPGPWEFSSWDINSFAIVAGFDSPGSTTGEMIVYPDASDEEGYGGVKLLNDAEYIAAANPATVLALLDELERTQGSVAIVSAALSAAERELQRLRSIESAARNLAKVKGRHHSELAMNQLLESLK